MVNKIKKNNKDTFTILANFIHPIDFDDLPILGGKFLEPKLIEDILSTKKLKIEGMETCHPSVRTILKLLLKIRSLKEENEELKKNDFVTNFNKWADGMIEYSRTEQEKIQKKLKKKKGVKRC